MRTKIRNVIDVDKVKKYMQDNGLTHAQFAVKCKISVSTLRNFLGKWASFKLSTFFKICRAMDAEIVEMFKKEE